MPKTPVHITLDIGSKLRVIVIHTRVNVGCSSLESGVSISDSAAGVVVEVRFYAVLVESKVEM